MNIERAHKIWTELGESDPMWAVLTAVDKRGRKWQPEEFFATGREEISRVLRTIREAGLTVHEGTALDFGCGLGRLSQALAEHFQRVDGVDVSASMIRQAQQFNRRPDQVEYHLNVKTDLSLFPRDRFDFIYSAIVLQHIPPQDQLRYIAEFMGLLKSGGVAYFQTIHSRGWRSLFPNWFAEACWAMKYRGEPHIPMYSVRPPDVEMRIRSGRGRLERKMSDVYSSRFAADTFLVVKPHAKG
jgi:2-polyprenyl-3-methyl-5-hydroxy-6-metoxy-1,4-benzoquinol methylase